jgi:osmotically-inducible protein OsmY
VCFTSLATLSVSSIALGQSYDRGDQGDRKVTEQHSYQNNQRLTSSFPATDNRGVATPDDQALPGSGKMAEEDRTGSSGPSGTRSTSVPNTGAVDAAGRVAKPAGDEAVTEVDRGLASGIRSSLLGHPDFSGSGENIHLIVNNGFVTIQGWVPSEQDRRTIADRIQEQAGVQGIDNQLLVRSQTSHESRH